MQPVFTIIIPVKSINDYILETVQYIKKLDYADWELLIVTNNEEPNSFGDVRIKMMDSGRVGPASKRDQAAKNSLGEILVFLDDDSYPNKNLLTIAKEYFENANIVAIGGPAITPPEDSFLQKVSGTVFISKFSGGIPERYISKGHVKEIEDWPSVNLMVRKSDFIEAGGFDSEYWPGEDTKLCLKLIKSKKKILYIPNLIVWHHRREGLKSHLIQVGGYGLHRGFFARRYPATSRKLIYFLPSLFLLFLITSIFYYLFPRSIQLVLEIGWILYLIVLLKAYLDFRANVSSGIAFLAIGYTFLTHIIYGLRFMQGIAFTKNLKSSLR